MTVRVIDVKAAEDRRDVIHRAVQSLAEGQIVAFPTETVYGVAVSALNGGAIDRLMEAKGRPKNQPFALAIRSKDELTDYVPQATPLMKRLAMRCWPGPVTLVLPCDDSRSVVQSLPPSVIPSVSPSGFVGLRIPSHDLIQEAMRLLPGPLALTSANRSGQPDAVRGGEVTDALGDALGLVLDCGKCRYAQPSTVVRVVGNKVEVLRSGVVSEKVLKRLSSYCVVFVCTGNTCRSPMAEVLMQKHAAERFDCKIEELDGRGFIVASAGLAAFPGGRAAPEAIKVMGDRGLDLSGHASQPLSDRLVEHADLILTMTGSHRDAIMAQWPDAADYTHNLCLDGFDVADPIGHPEVVYQQCADQIEAEIIARVRAIDLDHLPATS
ncbi:L-threonylcarbamoyladenylate synthase [Blastopirellula retiformator]|uniref:L-threonylcarbamoyladenylate synthase n=1 Tax=Blastopirellula retiformator TaxID=2527970 RepID=A0A5C5V5P0_9BACT|nr:L-threonylcarbamoyladenylate synthase [Blastopirellula retiformator]TWT33293.1 Low molecular weight protein-tyrosine-phosphatase YwlE [Blastopirellula retiformator]